MTDRPDEPGPVPADGWFQLARDGGGVEFRLDPAAVRVRGWGRAVLAGCLTGWAGSFLPGLAAGAWVMGPRLPGGRWVWWPVGAALVAAGVGCVWAVARWARRKALREGGKPLSVDPDGRVSFGDVVLVRPGAARGVRVEFAEGRGEDGDLILAYWAVVDTPGGRVGLPVPLGGGWATGGPRRWALPVGFADRGAAGRFAAAVARALGLPPPNEPPPGG